jgi:hypothetical protein
MEAITHSQAEILEACEARAIPSGWLGKCFCRTEHKHGDRHPSLLLHLSESGWLYAKCMTGHSRDQVVRASGFDLADWGPHRDGERLRERKKAKVIVKTYEYRWRGEYRYEIARTEPKGFFRRRKFEGNYILGLEGGFYFQTQNGDWKWLKEQADGERPGVQFFDEVEIIPYCIDDLLNSAGEVVWLVEGEECVDSLRKIGCLATTLPGGSSIGDYCRLGQLLRDAKVLISPDLDESGTQRAWFYAGALLQNGAQSVAICEWWRDCQRQRD